MLAAAVQEHSGIGYLINPSAPRIERYDIAQQVWLAPVTLAGATSAATVLEVADGGLYVACGAQVCRYGLDGTGRIDVVTTSSPVQAMHVDGDVLFVNFTSDLYARVTSIDKKNNQVIDTYVGYPDPMYGSSIAPAVNRLFGRTNGLSPADITYVSYRDNGSFIGGGNSPYHGAFPAATTTWVFPGGSKVVDDSGTVYETATLNRAASLGTSVDAVGFLANGGVVVLNGSKLTAFSPALLPVSSMTLAYEPIDVVAQGESIVTFAPDATRPTGFRANVVPLAEFQSPQPGEAVDPQGLQYTPDAVAAADDGTILLLSKPHRSIFRWSPTSGRYTQSIRLADVPEFIAYSEQLDVVFVAYASGLICRLDVGSSLPKETPFAILPQRPGGLAMAGEYLFAQDPSGAWSTHYTFAPDGSLVDAVDWNYFSREYVWSAANEKMYFFRDAISPNDLLWEEINATGARYPGEPPGGIGAKHESPLHDSVGFTHPIRVAPDGSVVVLGSGMIHDATTLVRRPSGLANGFHDATWLAHDLYTSRRSGTGTEVQRWSAGIYSLVAAVQHPGTPVALLASGDLLVSVTVDSAGIPAFALLDADLNSVIPTLPSIVVHDVACIERSSGSRRALFQVTLSRPSDRTVSIDYATGGGSASIVGRDYRPAAGTLRFRPGETRKTIAVQVLGDRLDEFDETFTVVLANAAGAAVARGIATGTIVDDDPPPSLHLGDARILEGDAGVRLATFAFQLSAASAKPIALHYFTQEGTATAHVDFLPGAGIVQFAPGATRATVSVAVNGDVLPERNEAFVLVLGQPESVRLARTSGRGIIIDDDATATDVRGGAAKSAQRVGKVSDWAWGAWGEAQGTARVAMKPRRYPA